jgi:hypothetical protein
MIIIKKLIAVFGRGIMACRSKLTYKFMILIVNPYEIQIKDLLVHSNGRDTVGFIKSNI